MQIKINKDEVYPMYSIASDQATPPMFDEKIVEMTGDEYLELATDFAIFEKAQEKLSKLYGEN